ncbi:MAG: hypothetical protein ABIF18_04450 [archaeon]
MNKPKPKDLFLFSWKKLWIIVVVGFISIILHNVIYALFNVEEAFFFILAVLVIPIYFLVIIIYSLIYKFTKRK